jgi:hypothetical protein
MPTRAGIPAEGAAFEIDPTDPISASLIAAAEQDDTETSHLKTTLKQD